MSKSLVLAVSCLAATLVALPQGADAGFHGWHKHGGCYPASSCYQGCGWPHWCGGFCWHGRHVGLFSWLVGVGPCHGGYGGCGAGSCGGYGSSGWSDVGCGGGYADGGCSSCSSGGITTEGYSSGSYGSESVGQERVIYDGPAAGAPATETFAPTPAPADSTSARHGASIRTASYRRVVVSPDFERGLALYRKGQLNEAIGVFETAAQADPQNALYQYYRALALFDLNGAEAAEDALKDAIQAEGRRPIIGWGQMMERVQGPGRLWIERARREAGLVK